jgi:hypothetical protein
MSILDRADSSLSRSSAMSGKVSDQQALASIVLWNSGAFDTLDIAAVLQIREDAVVRTLHAARHVVKTGGGLG